ncbi:MAG: hypothetical protein N5P05_002044 [Chroococcopsis gigantea SAG 12.99]|jgi:ABC-type Fe3+-siderophore transport system permease subunit|nr:hypothetical protein [Chlorogloea purpurea SAG 13.99]MDV3000438.1 hypothetical protein [Chroococcopsis gigantea SAG 12.99]
METLKHEIKKLIPLTIFFLVCFGYIALILKLLIEDYNIDINIFMKVFIGAIVAAKTVLILDAILNLDRFQSFPRYVNILYKTAVYTFGALVITFLEGFIEAYRKTKVMSLAVQDFAGTERLSHILATILLAGIVFFIHNLWQELDISFGKGSLSKFLLSRPQKSIE